MTDKSSSENPAQKEVLKRKSDEEACATEKVQSHADRARLLKHGGGTRKSGQSKREIMEELSRARFPWEE
jgi:hypothetical protein